MARQFPTSTEELDAVLGRMKKNGAPKSAMRTIVDEFKRRQKSNSLQFGSRGNKSTNSDPVRVKAAKEGQVGPFLPPEIAAQRGVDEVEAPVAGPIQPDKDKLPAGPVLPAIDAQKRGLAEQDELSKAREGSPQIQEEERRQQIIERLTVGKPGAEIEKRDLAQLSTAELEDRVSGLEKVDESRGKATDIIEGVGERLDKGETNVFQEILPTFGAAGGVIGDIGFQVLAETIEGGADLVFDDDTQRDIVNSAARFGKSILDTEVGQAGLRALNSGVESYNAWKEENPTLARNFEGLLKTLDGALTLTGAGAAVSKGAQVGVKGTKLAIEAGEKAFNLGKTLGLKTLKEGERISTEAAAKVREFLKRTPKPKKEIKEALQKAMDERTIDAVEGLKIAEEFGIDLPASAVAPGPLAKSEQVLAEGFFGGSLKKRAQKAADDFGKKLDEFVAEAPESGDLGESLVNKFSEVEKARREAITDLYDNFDEFVKTQGLDISIDNPNALKELDVILDRKKTALEAGVGSRKEVADIERMRNGIANTFDIKSQKAILEEVGELANFSSFNPSREEKLFRKVYHAMKKDIDKAIEIQGSKEMVQTLQKANDEFKKFQKLTERSFVKTIKTLGKKGDVDTIANKLTNTRVSTNEIGQIYETVGPELTEQIQKKMIADIIQKAKGASGEGFKPTGFSRQLQKLGDEKMRALFTADQIKSLKNMDKLNKLVSRGFEVTRGSQTALIQQLARLVLAPQTLIADFFLSNVFNTKKGQRILQRLDKKTLKALEKQGVDLPESLKSPPKDFNPVGTTANATEFRKISMKAQTPDKSLTEYSVKELEGFETVLINDGKAGFALKPIGKDGTMELANVFSLEKGNGGDAVYNALIRARAAGAKKVRLDAYERLQPFYEKYGFKTVDKLKFDPKIAGFENGEDIVIMEFNF